MGRVDVAGWLGQGVTLSDNNKPDVNVYEISDDATAADNFETMTDGTGGQILSLRGLHIRGTAGNDTAFIATGYGAGMGGFFYGGTGTDAYGLVAKGQSENAYGFVAMGTGTNAGGFYAKGSNAAHGMYAEGGATGSGFVATASGTGGHGMSLTGAGTGHGLRVLGGATNGNGINATGQGTGLDLYAPLFIDGIWNEDTTGHNTAKSFAVMLKDTTAYQGAAGGASAAEVWNYDISDFDDTSSGIRAGQFMFNVGLNDQSHSTATLQMKVGDYAGGAGDDNNLKDDIDAISAASGSGPRLCSLMVVDATPAAITGGFTRMTSGATTYTSDISGDGYAVYSLTDATWSGLVYIPGYAQDTIPQTFVVTASMKDTMTMTAQTVTGADDPDKCNAYLWVFDIFGDTIMNAKLTAEINGNGPWFATDDSAAIIIPKKISATSDDTGYVFIPLWRSSEVVDAEDNNPTFNFTLEKSRYLKWSVEDVTIPDASTYWIKP
jgi:hypothetical protein